MTATFIPYGGIETVTGANFLLKTPQATILVDCGLEQGKEVCDTCNYKPFPYDPSTVGALVVTHAHLDHVGKIPKLVREGFRGKIYATPPTCDLAKFILEDSLHIIEQEARRAEREPFYSKEDVERALQLFTPVPYHQKVEISGDLSFEFFDAGHILGSAMVKCTHEGKHIVFTGDLGNSPSPLLSDTEVIDDADYLIMESVYGDRNHEPHENRVPKLRALLAEAIKRGGALMIPAFSMERTQLLLYELSNLMESGEVPKVPVFLDSPLAIAVTEVYKKYAREYFKKELQPELAREGDIFSFSMLTKTGTREESQAIRNIPNPKIIIAGAGMSHGGRIQFHEQAYLHDPRSTLLIVGYQAPGSLGRRLIDGAKQVHINGSLVSVRARVETLMGFSAHKDRDGLVAFVEPTAQRVKKVFVAMGEPKTSLFLTQRLREYLGVNALVPKAGEAFELS